MATRDHVLERLVKLLTQPNRDNKHKYRKYITNTPGIQFDLIDIQNMPSRKGWKYILTVIEQKTRLGYAVLLRSKRSDHVGEALKPVIKHLKENIPDIKIARSDKGNEFIRETPKILKSYGFDSYKRFNKQIASSSVLALIERFNRTIIEKLNPRLILNEDIFQSLGEIINEYNESVHSTTKCKPNDAVKGTCKLKDTKKDEDFSGVFPYGTKVLLQIPILNFQKRKFRFYPIPYMVTISTEYDNGHTLLNLLDHSILMTENPEVKLSNERSETEQSEIEYRARKYELKEITEKDVNQIIQYYEILQNKFEKMYKDTFARRVRRQVSQDIRGLNHEILNIDDEGNVEYKDRLKPTTTKEERKNKSKVPQEKPEEVIEEEEEEEDSYIGEGIASYKDKLPIIDFDTIIPKDKAINEFENVPQAYFRLVISGASGTGKTNLLLNMILNYMYFDALYIYYKNINEDKYQVLNNMIKVINEELAIERRKIADAKGLDYGDVIDPKDKIIHIGHKIEDIIPLKTFEEDANLRAMQKIIVIDDFLAEKEQSVIENYYIYSRKLNFSCVYIGQTFHSIPKVIRSNSSDVIFMKHPKREVGEISKTYSGVLDSLQFRKLFMECTSDDYGFIYIRPNSKPDDMFRCGFSYPKKFE